MGLGQHAYKTLKYAPFPVVAAPAGMALGGGCEILLHSDAIQAHAETYTGLVEVGVGLIPGWGGCKEMLARWQEIRQDAERPDARRRPGFRNDQHGAGRQIRRRSAGNADPARRRRDHHEPNPAAGRRQGQGAEARRELPAAGAAQFRAPRPLRQGRARHGGRGPSSASARRPGTTRSSPAFSRKSSPATGRIRPRRSPRTGCPNWSASAS